MPPGCLRSIEDFYAEYRDKYLSNRLLLNDDDDDEDDDNDNVNVNDDEEGDDNDNADVMMSRISWTDSTVLIERARIEDLSRFDLASMLE